MSDRGSFAFRTYQVQIFSVEERFADINDDAWYSVYRQAALLYMGETCRVACNRRQAAARAFHQLLGGVRAAKLRKFWNCVSVLPVSAFNELILSLVQHRSDAGRGWLRR